ncbi:MAG: response regulator [Cyanobacteria bacterium P01_D01_bin.44]
MHERFELISVVHRLVESPQGSRVHIVGDSIEWCLDIVNGQLLFAAHSLQYLTTLETVLPGLGYEAALPVYQRLAQLGPYKRRIKDQGLEALDWTSKVLGALVQYKTLNLEQAEKALAKVSEDAVEALLGLESATVTWHPLPTGLWYLTTCGVDLFPLLNRLSERLQGWLPLSDRMISPHQRPYCEAPESLYASVPQGALPHQMLEALARLMQGASIRQLAQVVRQDELKLAQLLYPYIEHRVIKLWPPVSPLDQLPWLPTRPLQPIPLTAPPTPLINNCTGIVTRDSFANHSATFAKTRHQIVCIDDNKLVLEKVQSYLDPEHFEITTCVDPMSSIAKLCAIKPDLVLLDISMPRLDGHSFCRTLRRSSIFKNIPIIMISSHTSALSKAKARSVGATDYLEKPFSQAQLIAILGSYLNASKSVGDPIGASDAKDPV